MKPRAITLLLLLVVCAHVPAVQADNRGPAGSAGNAPANANEGDSSTRTAPGAAPIGTVFPSGKQLLQLMMIVKNEATSIEAVLRSSLPHADSWYIMDTGSDDDTIDIITRVTNEFPLIPGVLDEQPFEDFATTRNLALDRSGTDTMYKLFIDGDWYLEGAAALRTELTGHAHHYSTMHDGGGRSTCWQCTPCFRGMAPLGNASCSSPGCTSCTPAFLLRLLLGSLDYYVPRIIRSDAPDRFVGVVHEVIGPHGVPHLKRDAMIIVNATATNREQSKERWYRDKGLLERELEKNPGDVRTAFYLAQTYELIGEPTLAYEMNLKRVALGGWVQERYVALLRAGRQALKAGMPFETAKAHWLDAHVLLPDRCESLYEIANWYKIQQQHALCSIYAVAAVAITTYPPADSLFIESEVYNYHRHDVLGVCAWYTKQYEAGYAAAVKALAAKPTAEHTRRNVNFYKGKVVGFQDPDASPGQQAIQPGQGATGRQPRPRTDQNDREASGELAGESGSINHADEL